MQTFKDCRRKRTYLTREEAEHALRQKPPIKGKILHAYLCDLCYRYHVGNRKRRK
jgi:hypothetical protein